MIEEQVHFYSEGLMLEGVLSYHENTVQPPLVLVCPPHPHLGGDMENNVIAALSNGMAERGYATLKFNYRGVGNSQSRHVTIPDKYNYWEAVMNRDDYTDALTDASSTLNYLVSCMETDNVYVAGYSFGSVVAMKLSALNSRVKAFALISTPFNRFDLSFLSDCVKPKLFICADNDFSTSVEEVQKGMRTIPEPKTLEVFVSCDHFYIGRESDIVNKAYTFFHSVS